MIQYFSLILPSIFFSQQTEMKLSPRICRNILCVLATQDQSGCHLDWITNRSLQEIVYTKVGSSITIPQALSHFKYVSFYSFNYTLCQTNKSQKLLACPYPGWKPSCLPPCFFWQESHSSSSLFVSSHHLVTNRSLPHTSCTLTLSLKQEPDATSR